ncbi:MAG: hypothetical protein A2X25_15025 [Chloroflexi bacterium GWB2_49_20]|nr:MAG: hypothetical protein A2X25_15025 [Chloroflexi bacterium GWB2_49_20]OGN80445.1 MAG: hypothetical protein A2X26_12770 [Chloroflexi bacterium GWC2_49_37]OGN84269.1 MAG: hypothetical protein A2X27_12570 [Chloroflexi bacterium GWD2_49_16]
MNWSAMIAFVLVAGSAGLLLGFAILRRKSSPAFREIPAFIRLRKAIGRAVEDGSRLHVSLGRGSLTSPQGAAGLAGLSALRRLADLTSTSDLTPIATSGEPSLAVLSQDVLQASYQEATAGGHFDTSGARLTGLTPFSYASGTLPTLRDEHISANILLGSFGVEAGLLTDAAERQNSFLLAASDYLPAQAVLYASAQEPLIGEELYAVSEYIHHSPMHAASLSVQDILRWVLIVCLLLGALLKLAGLL